MSKKRAIEQVSSTPEAAELMAEVETIIRTRFDAGEDFTTDDVWPHVKTKGAEPRAMGAAMLRAAREDLITSTSRFRESRARACHNRPKRVWSKL